MNETTRIATPEDQRPLVSRGGLRRLSTGLIAYGIIGLLVAGLGLGALVWVNGRMQAVGDRVGTSVDELATTLERTAVALEDASATAESFTGTIDRTVEGVSSAADTIAGVRSNLETLETVLARGEHPRADAARAGGRGGRWDRQCHRGARHAAVRDRRQPGGEPGCARDQRRLARASGREHGSHGRAAALGRDRGVARRRAGGHRRRAAADGGLDVRAGVRRPRRGDLAPEGTGAIRLASAAWAARTSGGGRPARSTVR